MTVVLRGKSVHCQDRDSRGRPQIFTWSTALRKSDKSSYNVAGLSSNCTQLYCQNETKICVVQIGEAEKELTPQTFRTILNIEFVKKPKSGPSPDGKLTFCRQDSSEFISQTALSDNFVVIVTRKRLLVRKTISGNHVDERTHGGWEPSALAVYEKEIYLVIALGQRKTYQGIVTGRILFHTYIKGQGSENFCKS